MKKYLPPQKSKGDQWKAGMNQWLSRFLWSILFVIILCFSIPVILGWKRYLVTSGSMQPAIPTGSCVFVCPSGLDEIRAGDIITFQSEGKNPVIVTHRVLSVDREQRCLITKGDANRTADPVPVREANVIGVVVWHLPYIGYFLFAAAKLPWPVFPVLLLLAVVCGRQKNKE